MSNKANKSPSKSPKKQQKKEEEPCPDLLTKDGAALMAMIAELKDKMTESQAKRNYIQNERDLLEQFANNTKHESEEIKMQISNKSTLAEELEQDHRAEVKVYTQKVKHLEYDAKLNANQATKEGNQDLEAEDKYHDQRLKDLKKDKTDMKKQFVKNEDIYQQEVKLIEQQQKKTMKLLSDDYEKRLQSMEDKYEEVLRKLRAELELKLRVEIHEVEERKNQHLNELMRNHEAAFAELKTYYNEITVENLGLIRSQKQRIEELQGNALVNNKLILEIKSKNKAIEEPLEKNRKLRDDLKYALRLHEKDKMALSNLRIKLRTLKEKISKTEDEQTIINKRYAKVIKDRKDLENRFEKVTNEVQNHSNAKNVALSRKLASLTEQLESKEAQLQQIIKSSKLDSGVVNSLCTRIQESIETKNALIKNIHYSITHASKAYNDAINVYEAKLVKFGVPADELGFEPLETKASLIPAGLVAA